LLAIPAAVQAQTEEEFREQSKESEARAIERFLSLNRNRPAQSEYEKEWLRKSERKLKYLRENIELSKLFGRDDRVGIALYLRKHHPEFHRQARAAGLAEFLDGKRRLSTFYHTFVRRFLNATKDSIPVHRILENPVLAAFVVVANDHVLFEGVLPPSKVNVSGLYAEGWLDNPAKRRQLLMGCKGSALWELSQCTAEKYLCDRLKFWLLEKEGKKQQSAGDSSQCPGVKETINRLIRD